jgi:hypothetical protein
MHNDVVLSAVDPLRFVPLGVVAVAFAVVWVVLGRSRYRVQLLAGRYVMVWHPLERSEASAIAARLLELGWLAFANREPPLDGPVTLLPRRVGELRPFVAVREQDAEEVRTLLERHGGLPAASPPQVERGAHRNFSTWQFRWGHRLARWYSRLFALGLLLWVLALTVLQPLFG